MATRASASVHSPPATPAKLAVLFGFVIGSWMVVDAAHRWITGDFVRLHDQLGPWANLVERVGWQPMAFAPVFLVLGAAWLVAANLFLFQNSPTTWRALLVVATLSLWYLGFGTVHGLVVGLLNVAALVLLLVPATRRSLTRQP